jgi:hypothetical protein
VADEVREADKTGLKVNHWQILDVTEACPPSRHLPDEPKVKVYRSDATLTAITEENYRGLNIKEKEDYVEDEAYAGCMSNCKLFAACRGWLATRQKSTSKFLKPIKFVQNQFRNNSYETAISELLCWEPARTGLIYPRLNEARHVITPHRAYYLITGKNHPNPRLPKAELMDFLRNEKIGEWYGGMDFGFSHYFAYSHALELGNRMFVTNIIAIAELEPDQMLSVMEPFRVYDPKIWGDTENAQMISVLKNRGYRMARWPKGKDSVVGGISIVKMKLTPTMNALEPELYFIRDVGVDAMMDLAINHLKTHHWKLSATGEPTDQVADVNKDIPDAVRYLVMNRFTPKGQAITSDEPIQETKYFSVYDQPQYTEKEWMGTKISELTGNDYVPQKGRPRMQIESMDFPSYYDQQNQKKPTTKGKKSGIIWDLG